MRLIVHPPGANLAHEGMGSSNGSALTRLYVPTSGTVNVAVDASAPAGVTVYSDLVGTVNQTISAGSNANFTFATATGPIFLSPATDAEGVGCTITGAGYP
jgi:hypothetical protein